MINLSVITPTGRKRATRLDTPAESIVSTTSATSLYACGISSAMVPRAFIARNDAPARHLLVDIDIMAVFLGLRPIHNSPSAMAGAAQRFLHGGLGTA